MAIIGRVYRLVSDSHPEVLPYYGSTVADLIVRFRCHKTTKHKCMSRTLVCYDDCRIELVEEYQCDTETELRMREGWWIANNPCCNKRVPGRTRHEYYELTKDKFRQSKSEWMKNNRDKMNEYNRLYKLRKKQEKEH